MNVIRDTTAGGDIGNAFGTGLGQGLQILAQNKLAQIQQKQQQTQLAQGLKGLFPNANPNELHSLSSLPPEILNTYVKQKLQEPGNQSYMKALQSLLGGEQQQQPQQDHVLNELMNREQGFSPLEMDKALAMQNQTEQPKQTPELGTGINAKQFKDILDVKQKQDALELKKQSMVAKDKAQLRKEELAIQEKVAPFLHAQAQDFNNSKKIYNLAKGMLANVTKNKSKWPNFSGYLPNTVQRDPDVRKYIADSNQLVTLLAGSRRGQPTNFKIKLEQASKPELNQPIETQESILRGLIDSSKEVFDTQNEIGKIKKEFGGKYPRDLETRIAELQNLKTEAEPLDQQLTVGSTLDELPDAALYPNAEIEAPNGEILISNGTKWKKKGK